MLGYLPSQTRGGGGGVWGNFGSTAEKWRSLMARCFSRSRRVTTLEPQRTVAVVSGRVNMDGVRKEGQDVTWTHQHDCVIQRNLEEAEKLWQ